MKFCPSVIPLLLFHIFILCRSFGKCSESETFGAHIPDTALELDRKPVHTDQELMFKPGTDERFSSAEQAISDDGGQKIKMTDGIKDSYNFKEFYKPEKWQSMLDEADYEQLDQEMHRRKQAKWDSENKAKLDDEQDDDNEKEAETKQLENPELQFDENYGDYDYEPLNVPAAEVRLDPGSSPADLAEESADHQKVILDNDESDSRTVDKVTAFMDMIGDADPEFTKQQDADAKVTDFQFFKSFLSDDDSSRNNYQRSDNGSKRSVDNVDSTEGYENYVETDGNEVSVRKKRAYKFYDDDYGSAEVEGDDLQRTDRDIHNKGSSQDISIRLGNKGLDDNYEDSAAEFDEDTYDYGVDTDNQIQTRNDDVDRSQLDENNYSELAKQQVDHEYSENEETSAKDSSMDTIAEQPVKKGTRFPESESEETEQGNNTDIVDQQTNMSNENKKFNPGEVVRQRHRNLDTFPENSKTGSFGPQIRTSGGHRQLSGGGGQKHVAAGVRSDAKDEEHVAADLSEKAYVTKQDEEEYNRKLNNLRQRSALFDQRKPDAAENAIGRQIGHNFRRSNAGKNFHRKGNLKAPDRSHDAVDHGTSQSSRGSANQVRQSRPGRLMEQQKYEGNSDQRWSQPFVKTGFIDRIRKAPYQSQENHELPVSRQRNKFEHDRTADADRDIVYRSEFDDYIKNHASSQKISGSINDDYKRNTNRLPERAKVAYLVPADRQIARALRQRSRKRVMFDGALPFHNHQRGKISFDGVDTLDNILPHMCDVVAQQLPIYGFSGKTEVEATKPCDISCERVRGKQSVMHTFHLKNFPCGVDRKGQCDLNGKCEPGLLL